MQRCATVCNPHQSTTRNPLTRAMHTLLRAPGTAPGKGFAGLLVACALLHTSTAGAAELNITVARGGGTVWPGSGTYADGSTTTLTATAAEQCAFVAWGGDTNGCTIEDNQITVLFDRDRAITAEFTGGPWAWEVVDFQPGSNPASDWYTGVLYTNSASALGPPTRNGAWGDITMFSAPYLGSEIVSIGEGGFLAIRFENAVSNDVQNPFGADFIVFGNSFFFDDAYPAGQTGTTYSDEPGTILVSQDGSTWHTIPSVTADGLFPSQGYRDTSTPYTSDGSIPTDFLFPVDTNLTWRNSTYESILAQYNGSGGGTPVDIAETGLEWIRYVMISQAVGQAWSTEIDAFSDVAPVPAFPLEIEVEGRGTVTPPAGTYAHGTNLTLEASPGTYFVFDAWSGGIEADTATNPASLVMDRPRRITAHFAPELAAYETPVYWLVDNGLTNALYPTFDDAAGADHDGDGFKAWQEFLAGTDPHDEDSFFRIIRHAHENGSNLLQWIGGTNGSALPFTVMGSTNLNTGWHSLAPSVARDASGTNTWYYEQQDPKQYILIRVAR